MRTVDAAITAGEISPAPAFRHKAVIYNPLLAFGAPSSNADGSLSLTAPQTYRLRSSGNVAYAAYRHTNGTHYLKAVDLTSAANAALSATNAVTIANSGTMAAMRSGFSIESGTHYIYTAIPSGSAIQVRRASLSGTSNPLTASFSNYGPTFGSALTNTSSLVRRVEAVCPCDNGQVVVAVGEHDFTNDLSTITFWLLPDNSTAVQLNAILHIPLTQAYATWYGAAEYCAFVSAAYESASDRIIVVANASSTGRAVFFTIQNGVESTVRNVIPIDASVSTVSFTPCGLSSINGWLYLSGHMTRRRTSGASLTSYECYLIGDASGDFSLGEKSHVVTTSTCNGTLLLPASGTTVYYIGNGYHATASATPLQNSSVAGTEYTDRLIGWTLDQGVNGADGFSATLDNADGTLTSDALLAGGKVLQLQSGQESTYANIGEYGLDRPRVAISTQGRGPLAIAGRSLGDKTLLNWKSPLTLQLMARSHVKSDLSEGLAGLIQKTNEMISDRLLYTSNGMIYLGLNEPWIALADEYDHGDGMTHVVAKADISDNYHLSTLGVLIGASDDGEGNLFVVPKDGVWGDDVLTGPQMRVLDLNDIDPLDPEKADTGFNMTARVNGLVKAPNSANRRSAASNVTYATSTSWAMAAGTQYGVLVRTAGRRAQVFTRTWNLDPAACAANAGYTLRAEALFNYAARKNYSDTPRAGLALSTDVPGSTEWFDQGQYGDVSAQLTYASTLDTSYFTRLAGNGTFDGSVATADDSVSFGSTPASIQTGMIVRLYKAGYIDALYLVANRTSTRIDLYDYRSTTPASLRPQTDVDKAVAVYIIGTDANNFMGYASSGARKDAVTGGTVWTETRARKRMTPAWYRGAFITDDTTAIAIRLVETDGNNHLLRTGSTYSGGTYEGWDYPTYPTVAGARSWRLLAHGGRFFDGAASQFGLPSTGYFVVDDEVIRYAELPAVNGYLKRGYYPGDTLQYQAGVYCPAAYLPLAGSSGPTSTLTNFKTYGGIIPGDHFDTLATDLNTAAAGLLVEIVTRDGPVEGDSNLYIASVSATDPPTATLTGAYPNLIVGAFTDIDNPSTSQADKDKAISGDLAIVSGRGQFNSTKTTHDAGAPVVYYPCDSSGQQASITVESYRFFSGLYRSLGDAIQRVCRLAGMRSAAFRYAFSTPTAAITQAITTSAATLPAREDLADFVLRMKAFVPVSGRLNIFFRDYYRLTLQHNGSGSVLVGLATTKTTVQGGVDADGSGDRWLGYLTIPVNGWISTSATKNVEITLAVIGSDIVVELGGQPLVTFDLTLFEGITWNYNVQTAGPIQVQYTASQSGNSATFELLELFDEAGDIVIEESARGEGRSARGVIDDIIGSRLIRSRATQAGGVEFSQFWSRDDAGELRKNLLTHAWSKIDKTRTAHQKVMGLDDVGESLDMTVIAADGYDYGSIVAEIEGAPGACQVESRLQMRENGEFAEEHELGGYGRLAAQPEDQCNLVYGPGGDIATQASTDMVFTSVRLDAQPASLRATYRLRLYKDVPS